MIIIGHRGALGLAPENSILGIKAALRHGVDMIELDVRNQNGRLVLAHEETLPSQSYISLEEALGSIDGRCPVNLDIKENSVIPLIGALTENYKGEIIFSSFKYRILHELRKTIPNASIAVLESWSGTLAVAEATLLKTKRLHINHQWLWSSFVRSIKHQGFDLYAYTVNTVDRAAELEKWGVDGIFTDYPDRFRKS